MYFRKSDEIASNALSTAPQKPPFNAHSNTRTDAMRLLYFVDEWPSLFERYLYREMQWMREHGHSVSVICLNCMPYGYQNETNDYIDLAEFHLEDVPALRLDSGQMTEDEMAAEALPFVRMHGAQLIDAHLGREPAELACELYLTSGIPYAVRLRGGDVHGRTSPKLTEILRHASAVCPMSQFLADVLTGTRTLPRKSQGIPAEVSPGTLHVVPGCLPQEYLAAAPTIQSEDCQIIGAIGRTVPDKRFHNIIEAVAGLIPEFPGVKLKIVGGGWTFEELQALASQAGIGERFEITGFRSWAETMQLARLFHIYVHASEFEGFGLSTIEAAFQGIPLVLSRTGANEQCVEEGVNGYLFNAGDVVALRKHLRTLLLAGARKREQMGQATLAIVGQRFRAERIMPIIEAIYQDVIDKRYSSPVNLANSNDRAEVSLNGAESR
jgi:glycosyltransferase involved in cell wall biosynthesis